MLIFVYQYLWYRITVTKFQVIQYSLIRIWGNSIIFLLPIKKTPVHERMPAQGSWTLAETIGLVKVRIHWTFFRNVNQRTSTVSRQNESSLGKSGCSMPCDRFFLESVARVVLMIEGSSFCEKCFGRPPYWICLCALFIIFEHRMAVCACKGVYIVHHYVSLSTKTYV